MYSKAGINNAVLNAVGVQFNTARNKCRATANKETKVENDNEQTIANFSEMFGQKSCRLLTLYTIGIRMNLNSSKTKYVNRKIKKTHKRDYMQKGTTKSNKSSVRIFIPQAT